MNTVVFMSFLPKPGETFDDDDRYELSGVGDDRLREEYYLIELGRNFGVIFDKIYTHILDEKFLEK